MQGEADTVPVAATAAGVSEIPGPSEACEREPDHPEHHGEPVEPRPRHSPTFREVSYSVRATWPEGQAASGVSQPVVRCWLAPSRRMLRAAFTSRSSVSPHSPHSCVRIESVFRSAGGAPQPEHI